MARARAARRYAEAAFAIALERNELDRWLADLQVLAAVGSDPQLASFLADPRHDLQTKRRLLGERLSQFVNPLVLNLMYLLVAESRLDLMADVVAEFEQKLNEHRGVAVAEITTAIPLDAAMQERLVVQLSERTGKHVVLRTHVDSSIIGGLVARIGDQLLDGSVRTRLLALKRSLVGAS